MGIKLDLNGEYEELLDAVTEIFSEKNLMINQIASMNRNNFMVMAENHEVTVVSGPGDNIYLTYRAVKVKGLQNFQIFLLITEELRKLVTENICQDEFQINPEISGSSVYVCSTGILGTRKK